MMPVPLQVVTEGTPVEYSGEVVSGLAVYFLLDGDGVIYVGQTINLKTRLSSHKKDKKFTSAFFLCVLSEDEANLLEQKYIRLLVPHIMFYQLDRLSKPNSWRLRSLYKEAKLGWRPRTTTADDTKTEAIGEKIKALRVALNWTQVELAAKIGTTTQTLHRWETGKTRPMNVFRRKLARLAQKEERP